MHWPWTFSAHPIPQRYDSFQAHVRMANMENTSSTTSPYPRSNKIHHVDKDKAGLELRGENGRRGIRGKEIRYTNLLAFWFKREGNEIITYVSHNWWRWRSFIRCSGPQGIKGPCAAIYPVPQVTNLTHVLWRANAGSNPVLSQIAFLLLLIPGVFPALAYGLTGSRSNDGLSMAQGTSRRHPVGIACGLGPQNLRLSFVEWLTIAI